MAKARSRSRVGLDAGIALAATACALTLLAAFVTHAGALWRDEISSVNTQAASSFAEMWRRTEFESAPPLYDLLLRGWTRVTSAGHDAGLRVFGSLGVVALLGGMWFAARRLGHRAPVLALALVAVNPEILRWSATVRPWGLGAALSLVTMALLFDSVEDPAPRRVALAAVAAVASVWCLFQNAIFLTAGIAGCVAVAARAGSWRRALAPVGVGLLAALSLLPALDQIQRRAGWNALGTVQVTVAALWSALQDVVQSSGPLVSLAWAALVLTALLAAGRMLLAATAAAAPEAETRRRTDVVVYGSVVLLVSAAGLLGAYLLLGYSTEAWYYIGLLTLSAVVAESVASAALPVRTTRRGLTGGACLILAVGAAPAWTPLAGERMTNIDAIAARLESEAGPGDLVIANPWYLGLTLARYYPGPAGVRSIPPIDDHIVHRYDLVKQHMLHPEVAMRPLFEELSRALSSGHRVWIVGYISAPQAGEALLHLGPAPLPGSGWAAGPYERSWSLETGAFLRDHAIGWKVVGVGVDGGRLESPQLLLFQGWRGPLAASENLHHSWGKPCGSAGTGPRNEAQSALHAVAQFFHAIVGYDC